MLGNSTPAFAEKYVKKYPEGHKVIVHYKVDEPSYAVLEPQNKLGGILSFLGLSTAFLLSVFGIWYARKFR
jgi:hypothetical protein